MRVVATMALTAFVNPMLDEPHPTAGGGRRVRRVRCLRRRPPRFPSCGRDPCRLGRCAANHEHCRSGSDQERVQARSLRG